MPMKNEAKALKMVGIANPDKHMHHRDDNRLMLSHPSVVLLCGAKTSGKDNTVKMIIAQKEPAFQRIICWHLDPEGTEEWLDVDAEMVSELPDHDFFDRDKINLLICDEQDLLGMSKKQSGAFDRLVSYDATHKSLSICICQQDVTNCPPSVRRACDYICYWPGIGRCAQEYVTRLTGHSIKTIETFMLHPI